MKRFQFRLQKVLEYKEDIEKQKMNDLAAAKQALAEEMDRLEWIQTTHKANGEALKCRTAEKTIRPDEIQAHLRYQKKLEADLKAQTRRVEAAEEKTEKQRQILLDAAKERKTLETLKDKKLQSHLAEVERQDRNFFDEVATMRHHRERGDHDR
jgi:flagellar protein FliJ